MADHGLVEAKPIQSYLIECLVWNAPNSCFGHSRYYDDVRAVIISVWNNTRTDEACHEWGEVNEMKYLFRAGNRGLGRVPTRSWQQPGVTSGSADDLTAAVVHADRRGGDRVGCSARRRGHDGRAGLRPSVQYSHRSSRHPSLDLRALGLAMATSPSLVRVHPRPAQYMEWQNRVDLGRPHHRATGSIDRGVRGDHSDRVHDPDANDDAGVRIGVIGRLDCSRRRRAVASLRHVSKHPPAGGPT